jgi:hypothetical protein
LNLKIELFFLLTQLPDLLPESDALVLLVSWLALDDENPKASKPAELILHVFAGLCPVPISDKSRST